MATSDLPDSVSAGQTGHVSWHEDIHDALAGRASFNNALTTTRTTGFASNELVPKSYADSIAGGGTLSKVTANPNGTSGTTGQIVMQVSANATATYRYPIALWMNTAGGTTWERVHTFTHVSTRDVGIARKDNTTDHTSLMTEVLAQMESVGPCVFIVDQGVEINVNKLLWPRSVILHGGHSGINDRNAPNMPSINYSGSGEANSATLILVSGTAATGGDITFWRADSLFINGGIADHAIRTSQTEFGDAYEAEIDVIELNNIKGEGATVDWMDTGFVTNMMVTGGRWDNWGGSAFNIDGGATASFYPQQYHAHPSVFGSESFIRADVTGSQLMIVYANCNSERFSTGVFADVILGGTFPNNTAGPHVTLHNLYGSAQPSAAGQDALLAIENQASNEYQFTADIANIWATGKRRTNIIEFYTGSFTGTPDNKYVRLLDDTAFSGTVYGHNFDFGGLYTSRGNAATFYERVSGTARTRS